MNAKKLAQKAPDCKEELLSIKDTMTLLSGKWKIQIIGWLMLYGKVRFMHLLRGIDGIAAKMLSKELHELEQNQIVARTMMPTKPVTVEYELTEHGKTLSGVIDAVSAWGLTHRKFLFGKTK